MGPRMPPNRLEIVVHPRRFELRSIAPEVCAGFEPLLVTVDWRGNEDEWLSVRVQGFVDDDDRALVTEPGHLEFYPSEGELVKPIDFRQRPASDGYARYEIEYVRREPPETLIVRRTLRLRR